MKLCCTPCQREAVNCRVKERKRSAGVSMHGMGAGNEVDPEGKILLSCGALEIGPCRLPRNATPKTRHRNKERLRFTSSLYRYAGEVTEGQHS